MPRAIDLRRVAEWTGTSIDEIQALNPELRRWTTPVRYPDYEIKVPVGTGEQFQARLAGASPAELTRSSGTRFARGESLATIARKLQASAASTSRRRTACRIKSRVRGRPGADHPARPGDAAGRAHRARRAGRGRVAPGQRDRPRCPRAVEPPPEPDRLPGQARRHALVDRAAVQHDRRQDQDAEPAPRQRHRRRRPAEDRSVRRRTRSRRRRVRRSSPNASRLLRRLQNLRATTFCASQKLHSFTPHSARIP